MAEENEAREAVEKLKSKSSSFVKSEGISQQFIRSHLLSFLFSPTRAYNEISKSNKSFLNGIIYLALVSVILTFASFFFQMVLSETTASLFRQTTSFLANLVVNPITSMLYNGIIIILVLGIALFLKNVSLKKIGERPFVDNYFNCMAFTSAIALIDVIPFSRIVALLVRTGADIDIETRSALLFLVGHIYLILSAVQIALMYMVVKKYLNLNTQHTLISLIPAAIPFLRQLYFFILAIADVD